MNEFAWDPSLSIGIDDLDEDHRQIFVMLEDLCTVAKSGAPRDEIARKLDLLTVFFIEHIRKEDDLMADFVADSCKAHRERHEKEHETYLYILGQIRNMLDQEHWEAVRENAYGLQRLVFFRELVKTDFEMVRCLITEGKLVPQ